MSDEGDVFYECVICSGGCKRSRNGDNGTRCKHDSCKKELTRRNTELRAARLEPTGDAPMVDSDPTSCFRIKEVLGVSMCLKLSKTEKRLGYEYGDEDYCYQVRGKYGGSKDEDPDDMVSDTRWVQLKELVHNMGESELSELDRWAGKLQKAAKAARLALRQRQESTEGERVRAPVGVRGGQ